MKTRSVLEHARGYLARGLSVIPVRTDGTKAPLVNGWREYAGRWPTEGELKIWFSGSGAGVGIPCGPASGNLVVLDVESAEAWERWRSAVPCDTTDFLADCPIVRTPRGGRHVWVRLPQSVPGTVLARRTDKSVMIEVRGEGHQVLAPGCPASCHPSGRLYEFESRGWLDSRDVAPVPLNIWFEWIDLAASLSEFVPPKDAKPAAPPRPLRDPSVKDPGSDFSIRGSWEETGLFASGWAWERQIDGDRGFVRRPGKDVGNSGTLGMVTSRASGAPLFYVFTSSGGEFEFEKSYDRFGVFARLKHGGDFKVAAKTLLAMGYGERSSKPTPSAVSAKVDKQGGGHSVTGHTAGVEASPEPCPEPTTSTGAEIILEFFRKHYRPTFRRGNTIHTRDGEMVAKGMACDVPTSKLIERLADATDAPKYMGGSVKRDRLPAFFKSWACVAWGDLLSSLPDEDHVRDEESLEIAGEEFRRLVRDALLSEIVLGDIVGSEGVTRTERRSLIDWCERFAKPGPWRSIRSKKCWCKVQVVGVGELRLKVAIRHELFGQVKADKRLCEMGQNKFTRRAERYGIGESTREDRPEGHAAVVLADPFVASLTAGFVEQEDASAGQSLFPER